MKISSHISARDSDRRLVDQYSDVAVIGLGVMGLSVVRYLSKLGASITIYESALESENISFVKTQFPQVKLELGFNINEGLISQALIVVSPGISSESNSLRNARRQGAHIIGDIDLFLEVNDKPVIAITGSNGKSTVTKLVGDICAQAGLAPLVAGNIGLPVLEAFNQNMDYAIAVLELSSFQLESCHDLIADSATILNISDDHLDRHGSMGDYLLAKARILRGAKTVVLPRHDEQLDQITTSSTLLTFGLDEPANDGEYGLVKKRRDTWATKGEHKLMRVSDIPIMGKHNVLNVLASLALVAHLDLARDDVIEAVKRFKGLAHRMQKVGEWDEVLWVNDSKATNIGAAIAAINSLDRPIVWIGGGQGKGANFKELQSAFESDVKCAILIGEDADAIASAIGELVECVTVDSMDNAVRLAAAKASELGRSAILFSPACASFDMFRNFEHRGDEFTRCALEQANQETDVIQGDAA